MVTNSITTKQKKKKQKCENWVSEMLSATPEVWRGARYFNTERAGWIIRLITAWENTSETKKRLDGIFVNRHKWCDGGEVRKHIWGFRNMWQQKVLSLLLLTKMMAEWAQTHHDAAAAAEGRRRRSPDTFPGKNCHRWKEERMEGRSSQLCWLQQEDVMLNHLCTGPTPPLQQLQQLHHWHLNFIRRFCNFWRGSTLHRTFKKINYFECVF